MTFFKNDKAILIKPYDKLQQIGKEYEIANITETSIIIRDTITKVAAAGIDIDSFKEYFKKPKDVKCWLKWTAMINPLGEIVAEYRTNLKKVEVRMQRDKEVRYFKASASCNYKYNDEFDLIKGLHLAYGRCLKKYYEYHFKKMCDNPDFMSAYNRYTTLATNIKTIQNSLNKTK